MWRNIENELGSNFWYNLTDIGIYNMFLFFSTGVNTNIFLGIIFSINGLYFMNISKRSLKWTFTLKNR
jgi:hypothetical protein